MARRKNCKEKFPPNSCNFRHFWRFDRCFPGHKALRFAPKKGNGGTRYAAKPGKSTRREHRERIVWEKFSAKRKTAAGCSGGGSGVRLSG
ncbi:MAG: hypothetical protein U0O13_01780, partial [Oscillospiraceae bacterium]